MCRALAIGLIAGSVTGGAVGTALLPLAGTIVGTIVGAGVGFVAGLINGIVLAVVAALTESNWAAAAAGGVTSLGFAAAVGWGGPDPIWTVHDPISWIAVATCSLLGAALSPIATRGPRALSFGSRGPRSAGGVIGKSVGLGACGGSLMAEACILVFDSQHVATASLSGQVVGSVGGAIIGLFVSTALVAPRLRPRR